MKRLCRFYCVDCDNAWMEIWDDLGDNPHHTDECDYCGKKYEAEEISE